MPPDSAPSAAEVAAVLAAPEPVREALRRVAGPGWALLPPTWEECVDPHHPDPPSPEDCCAWLLGSSGCEGAREWRAKGAAWLPVDPTAIAADAGRRKHRDAWVYEHGGDWFADAGIWSGSGESARLAAVRLLIAVLAS